MLPLKRSVTRSWTSVRPASTALREAVGKNWKKERAKLMPQTSMCPMWDRNRLIASRRALIATGGSVTAELGMRYSTLSLWLTKVSLAFMDESRQYGGYHVSGSHDCDSAVYVGDHVRQTPWKNNLTPAGTASCCSGRWSSPLWCAKQEAPRRSIRFWNTPETQ